MTVYRSFETLKKIFIVMSLAFATYFVTALFSGAHWGTVLISTFVPQINFNFASISAAVALLGATISPYSIFWQVQGEKEQQRPGSTRQKIRSAALSKSELIDCTLRKFRQVGVGKRAHFPLVVKCWVGFAARFAAKQVRKGELPTFSGLRAGR